MKSRTEIINGLIEKFGYKSYLEIGVRNTRQNFDQIKCDRKKGVDPSPEWIGANDVFIGTSNQYFESNDEVFDVIFVDGLHLAEQVYLDILNSFDCLSPGGIVVCHDMNPIKAEHQVETYEMGKVWNGTCWKAWAKMRGLYYPRSVGELEMFVIDTDHGVGIIRKSDDEHMTPMFNVGRVEIIEQYSYDQLETHRKELLNLITVDEFRAWLGKQ